QWARTEGGIIAPESSHAVAATIQEAIKCREEGKEKTILMCLSGHGHLDLLGYQKFLAGQLSDYILPQEEIDKAEKELDVLPKVNN
ncbi:MAG: TrpB-like pyridoxal-phosphate dependent enzyme, partial [Fibrobacter sp.]|nr:TrpB-like pyridoxal-phosphate dependent enzyme [Fibrobacter sp.]